METLLQVLLDGMLNGMVYALVATGLCLIWGVMDVINFAHGEYLMVAMYVSYWLGFLANVDPLISILAGGAFIFILGALTYKLIIRYTIGKPPLVGAAGHLRAGHAAQKPLPEPVHPQFPHPVRHLARGQNIPAGGDHRAGAPADRRHPGAGRGRADLSS